MMRAQASGGVGLRSRAGRELRSFSPSTPSLPNRRHHLAAVFAEHPQASAACENEAPSAIIRTRRSRPSSVSLAFWWMFIRSLRITLALGNSNQLGPDRMDNLQKAHT